MTRLQKLIDFDLLAWVANSWLIRNRGQRNLFLALLALNTFTFLMFITHHFIHNHASRFPWIGPRDQVFAGRWFNEYLLKLNYAADIPVYLPMFSILLSVLGGMVLIRIWRLHLSHVEQFIVLGLLTTFPVALSYFYYTYQTPLFFVSVFFAILAVAVCNRIHPLNIIAGAVLTMLTLASYQPALSIIATIIASSFIADLIRNSSTDGVQQSIRQTFLLALARVGALIAGLFAYKTSLTILGIKASHATKTVALADIPDRWLTVAKASFKHLSMTQPDLLTTVKTALVIVFVAAVIISVINVRRSWTRIALVLLSWPLLVIATKAMYLVSSDGALYQYRYNGALGFFHAFTAVTLLHFTNFKTLRSVALLLLIFILMRFVQADLVRQEVLYRGEQHDMAIANRILTRMESLPDIDFSKTYDFVRIGKYSNFRNERFKTRSHTYDTYGDGHMDNGEVTDRWTDEEVFQLLGAKVKFKFNGTDSNFASKEADARQNRLQNRAPWPHESSVFIEDDTIFVYMK